MLSIFRCGERSSSCPVSAAEHDQRISQPNLSIHMFTSTEAAFTFKAF